MRLTEFIEEHRAEIIEEWATFAETMKPWSEGLSDEELKDHAGDMLTAVIDDIRTPQTGSEQAEKSKGHGAEGALTEVGKRHASERLETGLSLNQLLAEYRALRASVLRLWEAESDKQGELTRFNEAIDETLAESTARYSEAVEKTREQFTAILGHDLRNPLSAVITGATMLTTSERLDNREVRIATRIVHSAERMSRMVNDLLDLTRTRLGTGIPVTPRPMDLRPVFEQVVSEFEVVHPGCEVRLDMQGELLGEWDSDRVTQVLSNLVSNALQYGCEDGPISIAVAGNPDEVTFKVHNEGLAIPGTILEQIFEPMVRHVRDGDKNTSGLGLGLHIVREVVTAHRGKIDVTSTEKDGTTFTVQLPRRLAPPAVEEAAVH